jgi:hypothetical protein
MTFILISISFWEYHRTPLIFNFFLCIFFLCLSVASFQLTKPLSDFSRTKGQRQKEPPIFSASLLHIIFAFLPRHPILLWGFHFLTVISVVAFHSPIHPCFSLEIYRNPLCASLCILTSTLFPKYFPIWEVLSH